MQSYKVILYKYSVVSLCILTWMVLIFSKNFGDMKSGHQSIFLSLKIYQIISKFITMADYNYD